MGPMKQQTPKETELKRELNLLDATMINVGTMIGSGIFFVYVVAGKLESSSLYVAAWVIGGVVSLFGALAFAELSAAMPRTGGLYVYLKETYGPVYGYLYGWTSLSVINSASIAAVAVTFASYLRQFIPMSDLGVKYIAVASIIGLTALNCRGVKLGAWVQNGFTVFKIGALLFLIVVCLFLSGRSFQQFEPVLPMGEGAGILGAFGMAVLAALWSYDGWIEVTYTAGEVKNPQRNLPRAILYSTLLVIVLYLLVNVAYIKVLSVSGIAQSQETAADAAQAVLGGWGAGFVSLAVMLSTFGANNGMILGAPRIYYAMARDSLFFKSFGKVHPKSGAPVFSLLIQMVWSSTLVFLGAFDQLITYVLFASWFFYILCVMAVVVMRYKKPEMPRPYKTWGYPFTPLLFTGFALWLMVNTIIEDPKSALIGVFLIFSGLPIYFFSRTRWTRKS